jgi:hypothetical protein
MLHGHVAGLARSPCNTYGSAARDIRQDLLGLVWVWVWVWVYGLAEKNFTTPRRSKSEILSAVTCTAAGRGGAGTGSAVATMGVSCSVEVAQPARWAGTSAQAASHSIKRLLVRSMALVLVKF